MKVLGSNFRTANHQCTFADRLIISDEGSVRTMLYGTTIISQVFCIEREHTKQHTTADHTTTLGLMEPNENGDGGVVGIGSGSNNIKCSLPSCIVDPRHLPQQSDREILLTLNDILRSATQLESGGDGVGKDSGNGGDGGTGSGASSGDSNSAHESGIDIEGTFYMIGGGGGSIGIALLTAFPNVIFDVTEINRNVMLLGRQYFGFASSTRRLNIYESDGRNFLKGTRGYYDVAIIDASTHIGCPLRILTYQFLQELIRALRDRSVVISRIFKSTTYLQGALKTYVEMFGDGRVWYKCVDGDICLIVAFHFSNISSTAENIAMSRKLFGRSFQRSWLKADIAMLKVDVLCDPGMAHCAN
jgi:hypothetical protein